MQLLFISTPSSILARAKAIKAYCKLRGESLFGSMMGKAVAYW
jgi:hypothetical protein